MRRDGQGGRSLDLPLSHSPSPIAPPAWIITKISVNNSTIASAIAATAPAIPAGRRCCRPNDIKIHPIVNAINAVATDAPGTSTPKTVTHRIGIPAKSAINTPPPIPAAKTAHTTGPRLPTCIFC
jgi:hypothetical protein